MPVPYEEYVGDADAVTLMTRTLDGYRTALANVGPAFWATPWQPGKWTFREIMIHVAQWESIFGYRLVCGATMANFAIQPVDQDPLLTRASAIDGPTALAGFEGARRMNIGLITSLSAQDRARTVTHPQYGVLTVSNLITQMTGHAIHHLKQIQAAGEGS
jgi:hypothetical protein